MRLPNLRDSRSVWPDKVIAKIFVSWKLWGSLENTSAIEACELLAVPGMVEEKGFMQPMADVTRRVGAFVASLESL